MATMVSLKTDRWVNVKLWEMLFSFHMQHLRAECLQANTIRNSKLVINGRNKSRDYEWLGIDLNLSEYIETFQYEWDGKCPFILVRC